MLNVLSHYQPCFGLQRARRTSSFGRRSSPAVRLRRYVTGGLMSTFDLSLRQDADKFHAARATSGLHTRLAAQAFGAQYPAQVDPSSSCTWSVLAEMVGRLRLRPDDLLVDLGCGRAGTGLWLARAFSARLVGIDFSPVAIEIAQSRAADFLPAGRAEFRVGSFEETGLPDASAHGVVSMDALPFTPDRDAALRE